MVNYGQNLQTNIWKVHHERRSCSGKNPWDFQNEFFVESNSWSTMPCSRPLENGGAGFRLHIPWSEDFWRILNIEKWWFKHEILGLSGDELMVETKMRISWEYHGIWGFITFWLVDDLPLWKIMDFVSWDDYSIPNWMESHKIPWFQTTNQIYH
jgi:hypothetical protein